MRDSEKKWLFEIVKKMSKELKETKALAKNTLQTVSTQKRVIAGIRKDLAANRETLRIIQYGKGNKRKKELTKRSRSSTLTKEEKDRIIEMYKNNATQLEIISEVGRSSFAVIKVIRAYLKAQEEDITGSGTLGEN